MRVDAVERHVEGNRVRLSAVVENSRKGVPAPIVYEFDVPDPHYVPQTAEPYAAVLLVPSMRDGSPVEVAPPISPRLHFSLPRIRDILHCWWPTFSAVDVHTTPHNGPIRRPFAAGGSFFSGGVDSFYTLLKHVKQPNPSFTLKHAIFMRGVETRLEHIKGIEGTEFWVRRVCEALGLEPIFGTTNNRSALARTEHYLHWERHTYGSSLASIALCLSGGLGYVCIPASLSYNIPLAVGSTPLTDEMYSTEELTIVHDGANITRAHKVKSILDWERDLVLKHLRVCIKNGGGAWNCGRCRKCVRTAIPLYAMGLLERARFKDKTTDHWEETLRGDYMDLVVENRDFARECGAEPWLIAMLDRVIRAGRIAAAEREVTAATGAAGEPVPVAAPPPPD